MFGHLFVESNDFRVARQLSNGALHLVTGQGEGSLPMSFLNSGRNPGSLKALAIASRKIFTVAGGVPGGRT